MSTSRPSFSNNDIERELRKILDEIRNKCKGNKKSFLDNLGINKTLIKLAKQIRDIYENNKDNETFPFEVALIACCNDFLQHKSDAKKIRKFALLFRELIERYAVRYNEGNKEYIVASLGEINKELYSSDCTYHKLILFMTAFYTKSCLMSNSNPDDPINHIDDKNHTIHYQTDKIIRNILQCMIDTELTDDCIADILKTHIARCDVHVRGGTKGNGNTFSGFFDEMNDDACLSSFCEKYEKELKLEEGIHIGSEKKMSSCKPILIDMLLGIFNFALYAAYLKANDKTLHIFLASGRSNFIFESGKDGTTDLGLYQADDAVVVGGLHPNSVQSNLTNQGPNRRPPKHMINLDDGVTAVLEPLNGARITTMVNGVAEFSTFKWGPSDFFQRLYFLRVTGIVEEPQEGEDYDYDIDYKLLQDALNGLRVAEAKLDDSKEVQRETEKLLKEAKTERKGEVKALKEERKETNMLQKAKRKANRAEKAKQERHERKEISTKEMEQQRQKLQKTKDQAKDKLDGLLRR